MTATTLENTRTGDTRTRVEDWLDDKIQNPADLDQVDELLSRVQQQQELLRKQLDDARATYDEARRAADDKAAALRAQAEAFDAEQDDLDRRLAAVTRSGTSDNVLQALETRMNKIRNLEIAEAYIDLVQQSDALDKEARAALSAGPETMSLSAYTKLRALFTHVQGAQPAAEGAAPQLVHLLNQRVAQLYADIKRVLEDALRVTLDKMKWPAKDLSLLNNILDTWERQARLLLDLQEPDLASPSAGSEANGMGRSASLETPTLLPLEVMVQPLAARFRYHFYGDRPTNRLDKPEYFLNHAVDLLERHGQFVSSILGPILDERVQTSEVWESVYTDALSAFVTALLPMVQAKCLSLLPQISSQPQLLSHFIHELMAFDNTLRDSWGYTPATGSFAQWKGLTWDMLSSHGYFDKWLTVEKDFALGRYKSIRDAPDSADIDFDADATQTKPTKGAIRVNDLLETITDRYRGLSSFSQKMKFLMEIQLSIFDDYHNHLHSSLQAYLVSSHTAGRLLQGQSQADALGVKGLESLSKIFGSAEFLERKMSDWSDDVFFLELWDELQDRARANSSGLDATVGQGLSVREVAAKTSGLINGGGVGHNDEPGDNSEGGALFDETTSSYRRLKERSEGEILRALDINVKGALQPFTRNAQWSSLGTAPADLASLPPSAALDSFLQTTASLLGHLAQVIAPVSLRRITRHYCATVQREVFDNVILYNTFSTAGAAQLKRDLSAMEQGIESSTKLRGAIGGTFRRLEEAVYLLSLPATKSKRSMSKDDNDDDDGWGFDENEDPQSTLAGGAEPATSLDDDGEQDWSLWDAEKRIFESNEAARKALLDMGLYHLSEGEARNVLKRRVELNG